MQEDGGTKVEEEWDEEEMTREDMERVATLRRDILRVCEEAETRMADAKLNDVETSDIFPLQVQTNETRFTVG